MINNEELGRLQLQYPELSIKRKIEHVPMIHLDPHRVSLTMARSTGKSRPFADLMESMKGSITPVPPIRISLEDEMNRLDRLMANGIGRGEMFCISAQHGLYPEMVWEEPKELPVAKKRRERNQFNGLNANGLPSAKSKRRGGR